MVFGLSTGHEIGLALTGGAFILFALISSFVLPAKNPNFPGRYRNVYLVVCACFFLAMMGAVLVFGKEKKAEASTAPITAGNAANGKALFTSSTCSACHTFKAAGSTAKVGPDLDNLATDAAAAKLSVTTFATDAITNPPAPYVPPGYPKNAMPKLPLTPSQVADIVAFLTAK